VFGALVVWQMNVNTEDAASGSIVSGESYVSDSSDEENRVVGMPADNGGDPAEYSVMTMISSFGEAKMDSDISVNNGSVLFSDALTEAMKAYGGDVKYRVIVELFSGGAAMDCASEEGKTELERFAGQGYTVAFETYNDGHVEHHYFTLHATMEQLENFPSVDQYGYCVMLYGERMEINDMPQENALSQAVDIADTPAE
jgi:hypothetical protein